MIIIKRKRIILVSLVILVSIFTYSITINKTENTMQTVAIPVTDKVIVIDAGHGVPDEGAQSSNRNN